MIKKSKYPSKLSLLAGMSILLPMSIIPASGRVPIDTSLPVVQLATVPLRCLDGSAFIVDSNTPQGFRCEFALPPTRDKWDNLADCETGDRYYDKKAHHWVFITGTARWDIDGPFDGGIQIWPPNWIAYGGREFARTANLATRAEQKIVGARILTDQGRHAWPWCTDHGAW